MNNEIAKEHNLKGESIKIRCKDTGKLWFIIDNSYNLNEAEFIHPETAEADTTKFKTFFDDIRFNELVTMTEYKQSLFTISKVVETNTKHIGNIAEDMGAILSMVKAVLHKLNPEESENINSPDDSPADYIG